MPILSYSDDEALGVVQSVDTASVVVRVENLEQLRQLQVNRLVALQSSRAGQHLIGVVHRISRSLREHAPETSSQIIDDEEPSELNLVRVTLLGTFFDQIGVRSNVLRRTLESVPEIESKCFPVEGARLTEFMRSVSGLAAESENRLLLGNYALDENAEAFIDGNKFFQRHAVIVGSTGSGKSWTVARLVEQIAELPNGNAVLFDIHGEYRPLVGDGIRYLRIAGPGDLSTDSTLADGVIYLPYWMLGYEDLIAMLVDRSDQNAPNQATVLAREVTRAKQTALEAGGHTQVLANFTIESPVPFSLDDVVEEFRRLDTEMVPGSSGRPRQGDLHGRLSRMILRLENRRSDRRLGFMFAGPASTNEYGYLPELATTLMVGTHDHPDNEGGVKIIDFSEVPSDVLPLMVGLVAKMIFVVQQWADAESRRPIALICDEAHLYIPSSIESGSMSDVSLRSFERVAKEGRKYGMSLVVITQRPSEVSRAVLSQCNNFLSMRLTNAEDQAVIRRLFPEGLAGFSELLPILDTGEALLVGDASLLPTRVRIAEPTRKPSSATVEFWDEWAIEEPVTPVIDAVEALRRQSRN